MGHVTRQARSVLTPYARQRRPKKAAQEDEYTRQYNVMLRALQRISKLLKTDIHAAMIAEQAITSVKKGWG